MYKSSLLGKGRRGEVVREVLVKMDITTTYSKPEEVVGRIAGATAHWNENGGC